MDKKEFIELSLIFLIILLVSFKADMAVNSVVQSFRNPVSDIFFKIITNFALAGLLFIAVPFIIILIKKKKQEILYFMTPAFAFVINVVLKLLIHRDRPNGIIEYQFFKLVDFSFPSTHAMIAFALLPLNFKNFPKQKYFFLVYAILVGLSRIYLGAHYLSDVVAGAFFGLGIGYMILIASKKNDK